MKFFNWFKKPFVPLVPHVCEFKCIGYCEHYGQTCDLEESLKNPSWHHYPPIQIKKSWLNIGYDRAFVFQSHWKCSCGKSQIFFFLANPLRKDEKGRKSTIPQIVYNEMMTYNPFKLGSSRGLSIDEVVNSITNELCN